jgi:hypothetical protein
MNRMMFLAVASLTASNAATAAVEFTPLNGHFYTGSWVDVAPGNFVRDLQNEIMILPRSLEHATRVYESGIEVRAETDFVSSWNGSRFRAETSLFVSTAMQAETDSFMQASAVTTVLAGAYFTLSEATQVRVIASGAGTVADDVHAETVIDFSDAATGSPAITFAALPGGQMQWTQTFGPGVYALGVQSVLYTEARDAEELGVDGYNGTVVDILFVPAPFTGAVLVPVALLATRRKR